MTYLKKMAVLIIVPFLLSACLEDDTYEDSYDDSYYSGDSGDSSGSGGESYDYTYTCASGSQATAPIPDMGCDSEFEYYAEVFGCNRVNEMKQAACNLEACTGQPWACDAY